MQASASSRAIVVDVVNRDLGHAELVKHTLTASAVAVAVAGHSLVNIVVVNLGIKHSLDTSLETQLGVVDLSAGLDELCHAHAEDVGRLTASNHGGGRYGI
jgi:hypothetical protein